MGTRFEAATLSARVPIFCYLYLRKPSSRVCGFDYDIDVHLERLSFFATLRATSQTQHESNIQSTFLKWSLLVSS